MRRDRRVWERERRAKQGVLSGPVGCSSASRPANMADETDEAQRQFSALCLSLAWRRARGAGDWRLPITASTVYADGK
jgi:hypothetical protein